MTLEVIAGSELVLPITTYEEVEKLVADIMPHIPMATYRLLTEMLFKVRGRDIVQNAKGSSFEILYQISQAVNGIERAKLGNAIIKQRVEAFTEAAEEHAEYFEKEFGWQKDL